MKNIKDCIKKRQIEGLSIFKLHDKLVMSNINHEFIDRFKEIRNIIEDKKVLDNMSEFHPFDYQIIIEENNKKISLVQNTFSCGIIQNLIEVYNFDDEPIILDCDHAAELIINKNLNSYIIASNIVINDINENPEKILEKFKINH